VPVPGQISHKGLILVVRSGTFVGMAYAARYPQRVNQFVIDAVIPHGMVC
jgi:pimeloyl-ACP methyl ester carboxylesterase